MIVDDYVMIVDGIMAMGQDVPTHFLAYTYSKSR